MAGNQPAAGNHDAVVRVLLDRYGRSYATEAGIRLADRPAPLYQLLVLATLLSARITSGVAVAAARQLFGVGYRTPRSMTEASWQDRADALGRGHYQRYDESTATRLGQGADLLIRRWGGDLRKLNVEAGSEAGRLAELLQEFPGIGPAGAAIFLREVQAVWPGAGPFLDDLALDGAARIGLPRAPAALARHAGCGTEMAALAAALVRVNLGKRAADEVIRAAASRSN